jgi:peroxiredoxin
MKGRLFGSLTLIQITFMPIKVGSTAPDFTLKSKTDTGLVDVKLSANFGQKNTVLLFFPAAFAPRNCATSLPAWANTPASMPPSSA